MKFIIIITTVAKVAIFYKDFTLNSNHSKRSNIINFIMPAIMIKFTLIIAINAIIMMLESKMREDLDWEVVRFSYFDLIF